MARYSAEQWGEWIEQQQESGLSVVDFCEEVGVSTNSFYRWRAKLVGESSVAVNGFESVETASRSWRCRLSGRPGSRSNCCVEPSCELRRMKPFCIGGREKGRGVKRGHSTL